MAKHIPQLPEYDPTRDDLLIYSACKEQIELAMKSAQKGNWTTATQNIEAIRRLIFGLCPTKTSKTK